MLDVLFITPQGRLEFQQEVNGTMLIATKLLSAGYNAQILRFCQIANYSNEHGADYNAFIAAAVEKITSLSPKICSFYALWPYYHIILRIAAELKKVSADIIVVIGGPQATITAEQTLQKMGFVDYVCAGEGENTIVPFVDALMNKAKLSDVLGLYYRQNGVVVHNDMPPLTDLETLPNWDDRLIPDEEKEKLRLGIAYDEYMPIDAGRGCPFNCSFCNTSTILNRSYRLKSARKIVKDIEYFKTQYGISKFWLSHDALTTNKKLIEQLCDLFLEKKLNIQWRCTTRIDLLSEDLILKMKESGLKVIDFGLETGSERMQKITNKRLDLNKAKHMVTFLLKNKLRVMTYFMYGFPEETEQDLNETLELFFTLIDAGVQHSSMAFCRFLPGTKDTLQYFDHLVLDPNIKKMRRRGFAFGYQEELQMTENNKELFPFNYHLETPVRNTYQYVYYLGHLYQRFPNSIRYLRQRYNGDNLRFFKDFYSSNQTLFDGDIKQIDEQILDQPLSAIEKMIDYLQLPYGKQLLGLMQYDYNIQKIKNTKEDCAIQETYTFRYVDFKLKAPIEQYGTGKTEILLQKHNGVISMNVLKMENE